jgi:hypothetical protein
VNEVQRPGFIENVSLGNYKSLGDVSVTLRPLTVIVDDASERRAL